MKKKNLITVLCIFSSFVLIGCSVKTYSETKDRVDQELSGNRGYMAGTPKEEAKERKTTRKTYTLEVEVGSLPNLAFWRKKPAPKASIAKPIITAKQEKSEDWSMGEGNRGYITGVPSESEMVQEQERRRTTSRRRARSKYKVQKGDTLQKISQKFFGTTRKWMQIYNANRRILKSPDSIRPGQEINIPVESK